MYQQQQPMSNRMSMQQQHTHPQDHLQEQDLANLALSELKRTATEYSIAILEASTPAARQTFQTLLQKTLHDQSLLYSFISQSLGYGDVKEASQQDIQQELQKQHQKMEQLKSLVQASVSASSGYQQMGSYQQQQQPYSQTQTTQSGMGAMQPMNQQSQYGGMMDKYPQAASSSSSHTGYGAGSQAGRSQTPQPTHMQGLGYNQGLMEAANRSSAPVTSMSSSVGDRQVSGYSFGGTVDSESDDSADSMADQSSGYTSSNNKNNNNYMI
jgi:spore coat protein CotF